MSPHSANRVQLPQSEHPSVPNAAQVGKAAGNREIRVSVILKRKTALDIPSLHGRQLLEGEQHAGKG